MQHYEVRIVTHFVFLCFVDFNASSRKLSTNSTARCVGWNGIAGCLIIVVVHVGGGTCLVHC